MDDKYRASLKGMYVFKFGGIVRKIRDQFSQPGTILLMKLSTLASSSGLNADGVGVGGEWKKKKHGGASVRSMLF